MLKSKWKDRPDWTKADDYAHLTNAKPEVWAWEFLRRNAYYRKAWAGVANQQGHVYEPPIKEGETEDHWLRRVTYNTSSVPIKTCIRVHTSRKWGLQRLYDPHGSFHQGVMFTKPSGDFPRLIFTPDEFLELVEEEEFAEDNSILRVRNQYAMVAVDLAQPLPDQFALAEALLNNWKRTMVENARVLEAKRHASQARTWLRHLRVLDALSVKATYQEIARQLGGNKNVDATPNELRKEGGKFVGMARKMAKSGYVNVLSYKGTPAQ